MTLDTDQLKAWVADTDLGWWEPTFHFDELHENERSWEWHRGPRYLSLAIWKDSAQAVLTLYGCPCCTTDHAFDDGAVTKESFLMVWRCFIKGESLPV